MIIPTILATLSPDRLQWETRRINRARNRAQNLMEALDDIWGQADDYDRTLYAQKRAKLINRVIWCDEMQVEILAYSMNERLHDHHHPQY